MHNSQEAKVSDRFWYIYRFYIIILIILSVFLVGEVLVSEYILTAPLNFFETMIPSTLVYIVFIVFTLVYAQKTRIDAYSMGFHSLYVPKSVLIGFLATSGYLIVVLIFQMPLNYPAVLDIFIIGCFSVLIGFTEELMFRGYIQAGFQKGLTQMKAIFITGMLFALLHIPSYVISGAYYNIISVPSLVLVGLLLGFLRIHTGNIWGVILIHTTWNYYQFLYTPVVSSSTPIEQLIALLAASLAMWGSLVLSMLLSKKWIDRPAQMPGELEHEYSMKIQTLINGIWKLQNNLSVLRVQSPYSNKITVLSNRIKIYNEYINVLERIIPQINEKNYKVLKNLVSLRFKIIKLQNLMTITQYPPRLAFLSQKVRQLESEIQYLEDNLEEHIHFNS